MLDQRVLRNRVLGETSHTWSSRCTTLDLLDFEPRPWGPHSGWPIAAAEIDPCLQRAAALLGLDHATLGNRAPEASLLARRFRLEAEADPRPICWQFSTSPILLNDYVRFGPRFARMKTANIRVLTHATVTEIVTT